MRILIRAFLKPCAIMYFNVRTVLSLWANGNPLQCSCLENPRDGGAWWAAVYGVAQSWTGLKWLRSSSSNAQTVQCLTHGNASIRLYVNNYNCNKSCLGNLFLKTCTPDDTATVYLTQRHCRIHSPWLILCQNDLRMYVLGKGLGELLQLWGILFLSILNSQLRSI